jgi:bisphosphoglycerate-dependent phosphoglycerate mutase
MLYLAKLIFTPDEARVKVRLGNKRLYDRLIYIQFGEEQGKHGNPSKHPTDCQCRAVHIWRRSFDVPPPNGESLEVRFALTF